MSEALVLLNDLLWLYQETQAIHHLSVLRIWCRLDLESAQPQCYGRNNVFLGSRQSAIVKAAAVVNENEWLASHPEHKNVEGILFAFRE